MSKLHFQITTPERVVWEDEIDQVTLPTASGEITILPNHTPLVSVLTTGELVTKKGTQRQAMAVSGGFVQVQPGSKVLVLADTAERAEDISLERAEEAHKRAQAALTAKRLDHAEMAQVTASLEKAFARLKVARKHRSHGGLTLEDKR